MGLAERLTATLPHGYCTEFLVPKDWLADQTLFRRAAARSGIRGQADISAITTVPGPLCLSI